MLLRCRFLNSFAVISALLLNKCSSLRSVNIPPGIYSRSRVARPGGAGEGARKRRRDPGGGGGARAGERAPPSDAERHSPPRSPRSDERRRESVTGVMPRNDAMWRAGTASSRPGNFSRNQR